MELLSEKTLTMVLCGGRGERLYPLTRDRAKPSVPFLGAYRIIDFSLSNALNSGLRRIALLTQYKSLSLERHILNGWSIFHAESGDFIISLPAQGRVGDHWYEGTADAVFQNIYTIQQENPEAVLVLSGDHIYNADYRKLLLFFEQTGADAVIMTRTIPVEEASRFGVIGVDGERRIVEFMEKPKKPFATPWDPARSLISMGVYLFKTPVLIKALLRDARKTHSTHDFGRDIIPSLIDSQRVFAYTFDDYWEDIGTIDAYWEANMAFVSPSPPPILRDPAWPVRSYRPQYPPTFVSGGDLRASIIGPGGTFTDCRIVHSIIGAGVRIEPGAEVVDSILFEDTTICRGARLRKVIIDKTSTIPEGAEIGFDAGKDGQNFKISRSGIRVVPERLELSMIEKYSILSPDFERDAPRELMLLSIISQSFFQPFSLEDNLLVILTALTSGSGVGFNRAMLFLKQGDRLRGEMWLGPRSAEEAGLIWEVLSTPGIGYVEIVEHNRALVSKNEDTLSARLKGLVYAADDENALIPAYAACRKEILLVSQASAEPLVDRRFLNVIGVEQFVCIPLLARDDVVGEIILDNAITRTPITPADIKLAGICGLMAGNYIYSATLHRKLLDVEKMAAMGEMAMFVTHQLRNPIVAIGGFTEQLLKPDVPEEKRARNLTIIRDEIRRLEDIIYQMGHFLKVSLKEPVYFDPGPVIAGVLESPEIQTKARGYGLGIKLEPCLPEILCDPTSFGEVLRNLLDNAFDATSAGGTVSVRGYRKSPAAFVLSVRDTGRGLTNPDKENLFRPFFTTKEKGMGLGLPFIKRVMDTCGGKIEVQSRVGKGALFKLIFLCRERELTP